MSFDRPEYLVLILIMVPIGLFIGIMAHAKKNRIMHSLGSTDLISSFSNLDLGCWKKRTVLYLCGLCLLILAASGPQISASGQIKHASVDIMVVLDVSRSMSAEDFGQETRLQSAKNLIEQFMERLNGNRIALVTFAGSPFEQAPMTNDYRAMRFVLDEWVGINSVRRAGSDIIPALETAVRALERSDRDKVMILLSDGGGELDPRRATAVYESIRNHQIKVAVVGIGSRKGYLLKKSDDDLNPVLTALDEGNLKKVAEGCGGSYFDGNVDPIRISAGILSKRVIGNNAFEGKRLAYYIPLALAVLAFGMAFKL